MQMFPKYGAGRAEHCYFRACRCQGLENKMSSGCSCLATNVTSCPETSMAWEVQAGLVVCQNSVAADPLYPRATVPQHRPLLWTELL